MSTYNCGVMNCGGGKCVHELLCDSCPYCGSRMVLVKTTGFAFCSNRNPDACDYEVDNYFAGNGDEVPIQ